MYTLQMHKLQMCRIVQTFCSDKWIGVNVSENPLQSEIFDQIVLEHSSIFVRHFVNQISKHEKCDYTMENISASLIKDEK